MVAQMINQTKPLSTTSNKNQRNLVLDNKQLQLTVEFAFVTTVILAGVGAYQLAQRLNAETKLAQAELEIGRYRDELCSIEGPNAVKTMHPNLLGQGFVFYASPVDKNSPRYARYGSSTPVFCTAKPLENGDPFHYSVANQGTSPFVVK